MSLVRRTALGLVLMSSIGFGCKTDDAGGKTKPTETAPAKEPAAEPAADPAAAAPGEEPRADKATCEKMIKHQIELDPNLKSMDPAQPELIEACMAMSQAVVECMATAPDAKALGECALK